MTNPIDDTGGLLGRDTGAGGVRALRDRLGWLYEWEQAQWQANLRHDSPKAREHRAPRVSDVTTTVENAVARERETTESTVKLGLKMPLFENEHISSKAQSNASQVAVSAHGKHKTPELALNRLTTLAIDSAAEGDHSVVRQTSRWNKGNVENWQPNSVYVVRNGKHIRVSIRDDTLGDDYNVEVLATLRRALDRIGLTLTALSVNGEVKWEIDPVDRGQIENTINDEHTINYRY